MNNTFTNPEQIEKELGLSVLGILPLVEDRNVQAILADQKSGLSEAYRSLRTSLQFSGTEGAPRTLLVTSAEPSEGKSTTSLKLAQDFAALGGRVLIIDGDLRKPNLHRLVGLDNAIGLSNLLTNTVRREDFSTLLRKTSTPNVMVMTSGTIPPNPADLLSSPKMALSFRTLSEKFDLTIIDAPPVVGLSDAPILSRQVEATLFVISTNQVTRKAAKAALKRIRSGGGHVVGAVLAKFSVSKFDYNYNYSYKYMNYQYYSYGAEEPVEPMMGQVARSGRVEYWLGLAGAAIVAMLILLGQTSRFLEADQPDLALAFDPLNTEARIGAVAASLGAASGAANAEHQRSLVKQGLGFAPGDARLYSLLGETELRLGRTQVAYRLFSEALRRSRTEVNALQRSLVHSAELGDFPTAVEYLDPLLRRWPEKYEVVAPAIPMILGQPSGYDAILAKLQQEAPWRQRLLSDLSRNPATAEFGYRLLSDLQASNVALTPADVQAVVAGLMVAKRYQLAYRTFLLSLDADEKAVSGYVFDSGFSKSSRQRTFDWIASGQAGVQLTLGPVDGFERGARIRFLSKPVRQVGLQQTVVLPSGNYVLKVSSAGNYLKLPKGLFWSVTCGPNVLVHQQIQEGTYPAKTSSATFSVDADACPVQLVKLESGLAADSWKFRYEGSLDVSSVTITRLNS